MVNSLSARFSADVSKMSSSASIRRSTHFLKPGIGDRVAAVLIAGSSRVTASSTCLIKKPPKEIPLNPRWAFEME